jgi:hypothetical protein
MNPAVSDVCLNTTWGALLLRGTPRASPGGGGAVTGRGRGESRRERIPDNRRSCEKSINGREKRVTGTGVGEKREEREEKRMRESARGNSERMGRISVV